MVKYQPRYFFVPLLLFLFLFLPIVALAQGADFGTNYLGSIGLASTDIRVTIVNLIRVFLGILGLVLLLLIFYGVVGASSAGNEDAKTKFIKIVGAAVIGLIIIVVSYAATVWIMNSIITAAAD